MGFFAGNTFSHAKNIQHMATPAGQFLQYPQDRGVHLQRNYGHKFTTLSLNDQSLKVQWCTSALDFPSEGDLKKFCLFVFLEKKPFASLIHCLSSHKSISSCMLCTPGTSGLMSSVSCHYFPTGE